MLWGLSCAFWMFPSIYSLDASSISPTRNTRWQISTSLDMAKGPGRQNPPMLRTAILEVRRKATLTLFHFGSLMLILYRFNLYKTVRAGGRRRYSAHIPGADGFVGLPQNSKVYRTEYKFQPHVARPLQMYSLISRENWILWALTAFHADILCILDIFSIDGLTFKWNSIHVKLTKSSSYQTLFSNGIPILLYIMAK